MANIRVSGTRTTSPKGTTNIASPAGPVVINSPQTNIVNSATVGGSLVVGGINSAANVSNPLGYQYNPNNIYGTKAERTAGAVYIAGGLGIEKDLNVGGFIYGRISQATTSAQLTVASTNIDRTFYPVFTGELDSQGSAIYGDKLGLDSVNPGLTYNPSQGKLSLDRLTVASTDTAVSSTSGAVVVAGGVGVGGDLYVGNIYPNHDNADTLGSTSTRWAEAYVENIYTRIIGSKTGNIQLAPDSGLTEIIGDLRVRGTNPIGTAPVVTNVLYVTVDGDDTNDGRAMDASRACRTIGGAINSPYYQSGTQIRVSPGLYLENNPLALKPYTSVVGSDLRTTSVEPINKTQDLFHVNSGCYLNGMQFLNGRSGLLDGAYAPGYNRGAYATAFPPLPAGERIDLFHSPYIQNCTNQSGPWLKDGTLFVPSQTVQVPSAVGTGTWVANTTTIVVTVSTGTISLGNIINAGQQNPGFFNARTLMLANKPFLQEQVVKHINDQFPDFVYNQEKCYRDVGILLENCAYDAAFGGNEKSVESGRAYYKGVVSVIAGQESQTTAAINYLRDRCLEVITNTTCTNTIAGGVNSQVRNTVLTGGEVAANSIASGFNIVTDIINHGTEAAPAVYKSTGPDAAFVSAEILMQANRKFIQENTINWINNTYKQFSFNKIKCKRDIGLILDSVALDMLYPTTGHSQSTFAGLQYWSQDAYTGDIANEITTTTNAINYLKELAVKIVQNITPDGANGTSADLVARYQNATAQDTSLEPAGDAEVAVINGDFDVILEIIGGNKLGWSDRIIPNGKPSNLLGVRNAVALLKANKDNGYFGDEVVAYVNTVNPDFVGRYSESKCKRDVGFIVDSIIFDLLHGGNKQSVQSGLSYYNFSNGTSTIRASEKSATVAAFNHMATIARSIVQNELIAPLQKSVKQNVSLPAATADAAALIDSNIGIVNNIITNGPSVAAALSPISIDPTVLSNSEYAFDILMANKEFIKAETLAFIDQTYNPNSFNYNEELCYRDTGLIIDAVSQDILLGGNRKSLEAGSAYWNKGYNSVAGQETTTTMAINYARDLALQVIANQPVTAQTGTVSTQVINPFFQYGGDYMPQEAVRRNFKIITDIIVNGISAAPPAYTGGGLFALTGLNGSDVKISPTVTSVTEVDGVYTIGLSRPTVGFGNNATLYFGDTRVYPMQDAEVEEASMMYALDPTTWDQRKVDPLGSMGGSLVDGAVVSDRSPIQSFVYDAYTQVNQGGKGIYVTNNGYAQLVSVFTIFCSTAVQVDNGGIASITNSNSNFGDLCLVAKGYGTRVFSGTVYNPVNRAYPFSPEVDGLDQFYPNGYWPNRGQVEVFLPDVGDRPHIALVMEVEPPDNHQNEQSLPGFLNAQPSIATLTTGTIVLTGVDTTDVAIGNAVYIRDQFGYEYDNFAFLHDVNGNPIDANGAATSQEAAPANPNYLKRYVPVDTVVVDVNYNAITLNKALTHGGGDPTNPNYFTIYFCGKSYFTVLSSTVANNPTRENLNILAGNTGPDAAYYEGSKSNQISQHIASLTYLQGLVIDVISNNRVDSAQIVDTNVKGGAAAKPFIDQRFDNLLNIIGAQDIAAAKRVVPTAAVKKTGPKVLGAGSAITLLESNMNFLADMVSIYVQTDPTVNQVFNGLDQTAQDFILTKCRRDTKIILQRLIYDIESGGTYNTVMSGLSYWSRAGTHHIVELGEAVTRTDLFPDGATVNFYQRSYISASGYLFEYVGAGTNYGALPQRGVADPVQAKETVQLNSGKVFFTSTDQNGDFRIGRGLVISQATGVLSGRTFVQSLYANMTPFILAIE